MIWRVFMESGAVFGGYGAIVAQFIELRHFAGRGFLNAKRRDNPKLELGATHRCLSMA
jgi:hypothetical protein